MSLEVLAILAALALVEPTTKPEHSTADQTRMQCRTEVRTETRIGRRKICTTKRIWDQIRDEHLESTAHRKVNAERSIPYTGLPPR